MGDVTIVSINGFLFASNGQPPLELYDFHHHTVNTLSDLLTIVNHSSLWSIEGQTFKKSLVNRSFFLKSESFATDEETELKGNEYVRLFSKLMDFLWLAKDNNCFYDRIVCYSTERRNTVVRVSSDRLTTCTGDAVNTTFSYEDIALALKLLYIYLSKSQHKKNIKSTKEIHIISESEGYKNTLTKNNTEYHTLNRLDRAFRFLINAREDYQLHVKITYYVLILECLFSADDAEEVSHKVSERVAMYIGETYEEKVQLYKSIKVYYGIRSKYIHGQLLAPKLLKNVKEMCISLDGLVRKVLIKILTEDVDNILLEDTLLREWYNTIVFNKPVAENEEDLGIP